MTISPTDFEYVRQMIWRLSAIALEPGKEYLVESRLEFVARHEGIGSIAELLNRIRAARGDELKHKVVEAMTTNETSFFRDIHPFEVLRTIVLPDLISRRPAGRKITIWCAASSSGQEPYSIAMILREHFPELTGCVKILASDISNEMVEKTHRGHYTQMEVNRGVPAPMLIKYFRRHGLDWAVVDELKRMIVTSRINLIEPWPIFEPVDVIFLRNVLIYFDDESKQTILTRMGRILEPDGYLFLGGTESTMFTSVPFTRETQGRTSYYRPTRVTLGGGSPQQQGPSWDPHGANARPSFLTNVDRKASH